MFYFGHGGGERMNGKLTKPGAYLIGESDCVN